MLSKIDISKFLANKHPSKSALNATPRTKRAKGSSSVGGNSALESAKGSGFNPNNLSSFSILQENPVGTKQKWGDLPDESAEGDELITIYDEENKDEESGKGSVPLPQESAKGSGATLPESYFDALTSSSSSAHESSDWITNRINRLRNLPLDLTQMNEVVPPSVPRVRSTPEDRDKWIKFLNGERISHHNKFCGRFAYKMPVRFAPQNSFFIGFFSLNSQCQNDRQNSNSYLYWI
jgi:hypothetical protein